MVFKLNNYKEEKNNINWFFSDGKKFVLDSSRKEFYDNLFYIYTPEQQYVAKRVLSENSDIKTKKPCDFCSDAKKLKPNCAKCNGKK